MKVTKLREYTGHTAAIYSLCKSSRPGYFVSCGSEGIVAEWNLESGEGKAMAQAPASVFSICVIPDRNWLLLGTNVGELVFVDLASGQAMRRVMLHKKAIFDLLPLPDGQHVLASSEDGAISLWNLDRMDHIHWQQLSTKSVRTLAYDAAAQRIYAGASDKQIRVLDLGLVEQFHWQAHASSIFRLLVGQNGHLYSTGRDAHIKVWELGPEPPALLHSIPAHNFAINDLLIGPDGLLVSGSMDKSFKIWDPHSLELLKVANFEKHQVHWNGVNRLLWMEDVLLSCSDDRRVMAWRIDR